MGVDLSKLSNAELEAILSEGRKTAPKKLIKDMSDEELEAIAFGGGNVAPENKDQELTLGRAAGLAARGGTRGVVSAREHWLVQVHLHH
jgi:methylmalonyl-CoA mutase cobalamin-binding subunit